MKSLEFDIILVNHPKSLIHKAIRYFDGSKYDHSAIILNLSGNLWVCEAKLNGFRPTYLLDDYIDVCNQGKYKATLCRVVPIDKETCSLKSVERLGARYDIKSTVLFQLIRALVRKWFKIDLWIGSKNAKRVNCSEIIGYILGFIYWYKMTPRELKENERVKPYLSIGF